MEIMTDSQEGKVMTEEMMTKFGDYKMMHQGLKDKTGYGSHMGFRKNNMQCGGHYGGGGKAGVLIITWLAIMALLIAMTRYFWKKAD